MKIIDIHSKITTDDLFILLQQKLNQQFQQQRKINLSFNIEHRRSYIEINQPNLYEGFFLSLTGQKKKSAIPACGMGFLQNFEILYCENLY